MEYSNRLRNFIRQADIVVDKSEDREHLLRKLYKVFKDGYRPARGNESYGTKLENGMVVSNLVNCLGHVLNLRNQQFDDYQINSRLFGYFQGLCLSHNFKEDATKCTFDFIKETGLKVEECAPQRKINDFKSWKIALYLSHKDFHFFLEEAPREWSGKLGFENYVEHNFKLIPPKVYRNTVEIDPESYEFYGTYKITNPNADENNRYVQGREDRML
ncbi:MAG: hypothetical protein NC133_03715 [Prevotella sp.]|nr:hypothetical protein [Prevotella sp.]